VGGCAQSADKRKETAQNEMKLVFEQAEASPKPRPIFKNMNAVLAENYQFM
jgi:hypothetical protein